MNRKLSLLIASSLTLLVGLALLSECAAQMPKGAKPITNFDAQRYLGKWYEIARFDFFFEKNMDNTTAEYSLNKDNTLTVINRGYNYKKDKWTEAKGKAKFIGSPDVASLKVSFFGPFYSPYNVIALDKEYKYALVVGKDTDYIWLLSRTTTMPEEVKKRYLDMARSLGYDLDKLVWVEHGNRETK